MQKIEKNIISATIFYNKNRNISITKISEIFKIDRHTLSKYINEKINLETLFQYNDDYYIFEENELDAINNFIYGNLNFSDIKRKYGYKNETFKKKLKVLGYSTERKYKIECDRNKFVTIETEYDAYILGFILADGYINEDRNFLSIKISYRDRDILIKICNYFKCSEDNIKTFLHGITFKKQCSLTINSKNIVNNLKKYNLHQKKSCKEIPFYNINKNLIRHYIRGILDGDGFIRQSGNKLGFCGSEETLQFIKLNLDKLKENNTKNNVRFDDNSNIYRLDYGSKKDFENIINFIYKDSNIYLNRKYNLYQQKINKLCCHV